jgi:hypothetical protein
MPVTCALKSLSINLNSANAFFNVILLKMNNELTPRLTSIIIAFSVVSLIYFSIKSILPTIDGNFLPNVFVSSSNLIFFVFTQRKKNVNPLLYFPVAASFIYHLAEVKHGLTGYPFLNMYASELLFVDRVGVVFASLFMLKQALQRPYLLDDNWFLTIVIGFIALTISEWDEISGRRVILPDIVYVLSHGTWHYCAMKCLAHFI